MTRQDERREIVQRQLLDLARVTFGPQAARRLEQMLKPPPPTRH